MKKLSILVLSLLLIFSFGACGKRNDTGDTTPTPTPTTTAPTTEMPILPEMDPTLDTNIPDPDINTEMPTYTDGTDPTDGLNANGGRNN